MLFFHVLESALRLFSRVASLGTTGTFFFPPGSCFQLSETSLDSRRVESWVCGVDWSPG